MTLMVTSTPTVSLHDNHGMGWTALLWKRGYPTGAAHADMVLVESIAKAGACRETCEAAALRKAAKLGFASPVVLIFRA